MKKRNTLILLVPIIFVLFSTFISAQIIKTSNSETLCENKVCQTTFYSYEKYFFKSQTNTWEEIDESWHSCAEGYCTNEYYFKVQAKENGEISPIINNNVLTYKLTNFLAQNLTFTPTIQGNTITYQNILPNVDLKYTYFPTKLKEELVINQPIQALPQNDFQIGFTKSGNANFLVEQPIICDANYFCRTIQHSTTNNQIQLTIPVDFLNSPNTTYPVTIDPTITLNSSFIVWNGRVTQNLCADEPCPPPLYTRTSNPSSLVLGNVQGGARGDLDWNVSAIQDNANILNATLIFFVETTTSSNRVNITQMEGNNSRYSNDDTGNANFFADMRNGTVYAFNSTLSGSNFLLNFTLNSNALSDIESSLAKDSFSTGIDTINSKSITISAKDNSNATRRPKLKIIYEYTQNIIYDDNGNIIQGVNNKYLEYDAWNRVSRIRANDANGAVIEDYLYDHEGKRLEKTTYNIGAQGNNKTTYYVDENFVHIRNTNGTIQNETYFYANGKLLAMEDNEGRMFYYHPDHLGSTTLVTNASGDIVEQDYYLPYGEIYQGSESSRYLFTTKERDDTGFDYFGARYYDAGFMHFIQPDPIIQNVYDPQNLNRYAYTLNNPYKYTDPTGNFAQNPVLDIVVISAFVGALQQAAISASLGDTPQIIAANTIAGAGGGAVAGITIVGGIYALKGQSITPAGREAIAVAASTVSYTAKETIFSQLTNNEFDPTLQQIVKGIVAEYATSQGIPIFDFDSQDEESSKINGKEKDIKKLTDDELYYYTRPQTPIIPKSTGGGSFAPYPDDEDRSNGDGSPPPGCTCGCIMSCPRGER